MKMKPKSIENIERKKKKADLYTIKVNNTEHRILVSINRWNNCFYIWVDDELIANKKCVFINGDGRKRYLFYIDEKPIYAELNYGYENKTDKSDLFMDGFSVKTGESLDFRKNEAIKQTECGFLRYFSGHIKENINNAIMFSLLFCIINNFSILIKETVKIFLKISIIVIPITILCYLLFHITDEWLTKKNTIKKWDSQYIN